MLLPSGLSVWPLLCPFVCVCMCFEDMQAGERGFYMTSNSLSPILYASFLISVLSIFIEFLCGDSLLAFPVFIFLFFLFYFIFLFSLTLLSFLNICPWSHYRLSAVGVQVELMHSKMFVWCLLRKQNLFAPLCLSGMQIISPCQVG